MCFTEKPKFRHFSQGKQSLMKKNPNWDAFYRTKVHNLTHGEMQTTIIFFSYLFLCVFLKVDSAKSFKILSEAHPRAYLVANRIS